MKPWVERHLEQLRAVADGGYAKKPLPRAAAAGGWVVVSRPRKGAALFGVPRPRKPGQRGRPRLCGEGRISLAKRAGRTRGWQTAECARCGASVTKTIETPLATWRPAGGPIRVALAKEEEGWLAFFSPRVGVAGVGVPEAVADRGAIEQANKDVKEVWGPGNNRYATWTRAWGHST